MSDWVLLAPVVLGFGLVGWALSRLLSLSRLDAAVDNLLACHQGEMERVSEQVGKWDAEWFEWLTSDAAANVLIAHQRLDTGGCLCGRAKLGESHAKHVLAKLAESRYPDAELAATTKEGE